MTAYRYWGVTSLASASSVFSWNRIQLLDASGTNLATDPTKAQAPADGFSASFPPSNAITGTGGQACYVNGAGTSNGQPTWLYDFGSPLTIASAILTARDSGDQSQTPTQFNLVGSADGTTLETFAAITTPAWGAGESRPFTLQAAATPASVAAVQVATAGLQVLAHSIAAPLQVATAGLQVLAQPPGVPLQVATAGLQVLAQPPGVPLQLVTTGLLVLVAQPAQASAVQVFVMA